MPKEKLRSVNTHFWDDLYVTGLDPSEKLLFLYLITNPLCNLLGVYEISIKKISFDTGFEKDTVERMLERFTKDGKIVRYEGYIWIVNFAKNQRYNTNMRKGARELFETLPNGLQTISNGLVTIWKEEDEVEGEYEGEEGSICKSAHKEATELFCKFYQKKIGIKYSFKGGKDGAALKSILLTLIKLLTKEKTKENLLAAFDYILNSITDKWILRNLSIAIVNSKLNEILNQAKNETNNGFSPDSVKRFTDDMLRQLNIDPDTV